jgi:hypothetical protein
VYGSLENLDLETWRPGDLETWRPGDLEMYKPRSHSIIEILDNYKINNENYYDWAFMAFFNIDLFIR